MSEATPPAEGSAKPDESGRERAALVREVGLGTSVLATVCAGVVALFWSRALAVGILFGSAIAVVNFVLLARGVAGAIDRTAASARRVIDARGPSADRSQGVDPAQVPDRAHGAGGSLRMVISVVLIAGLLWLGSGEPLGVAIGVILVLITAGFAAHRRRRLA